MPLGRGRRLVCTAHLMTQVQQEDERGDHVQQVRVPGHVLPGQPETVGEIGRHAQHTVGLSQFLPHQPPRRLAREQRRPSP